MLHKCPQLSTKWRTSGKFFEGLFNDKSAEIKTPEYFWHWSRDTEIISFYILKVSLSLT